MDYQQQSNQGCLVVDLHYLFGEEPTREREEQVLSEGLFRFRDNYTLGCLMAFLDHYPDKRAKLYVDNAYYLDILKERVWHPRVVMVHGKNDEKLLESLTPSFVVYVDNHITDGYTHLPHFMMVTGKTATMYDVFDPWTGKTTKHKKQKILEGINLLRSHVKVCPFVIVAY